MAHRARPQDPATDEALLAVMGATCSSLSPERAQRLLAFHRALLATGAEALVAVDSVGPSSALQQLMFCSEPGVLSAAKLLHTFPLMPLAEADVRQPTQSRASGPITAITAARFDRKWLLCRAG